MRISPSMTNQVTSTKQISVCRRVKHENKDNKNRPLVHVSERERKEVTDRWVVNKSDKILTDPELSVLQNGMNFAVSPSHIPVVEFITGIESVVKLIGTESDEAARLRLDCVDL